MCRNGDKSQLDRLSIKPQGGDPWSMLLFWRVLNLLHNKSYCDIIASTGDSGCTRDCIYSVKQQASSFCCFTKMNGIIAIIADTDTTLQSWEKVCTSFDFTFEEQFCCQVCSMCRWLVSTPQWEQND